MGLVPFGGFIVTTAKSGNYIGHQKVDEQSLRKIAEILGIQQTDFNKFASDFTSIYIYRGAARPEKKPP
jgi:hypothetical protein